MKKFNVIKSFAHKSLLPKAKDGMILKSKYAPGGIRVPYANASLTAGLSFYINPQPQLDYYANWLDNRRKILEQNMKDTGTYPETGITDTFKNWMHGYQDGRVILNKEIYKLLNNAAEPIYMYNIGELEDDENGEFREYEDYPEVIIRNGLNPLKESSIILHELTHSANRPKLINEGLYDGNSATSPQELKIKLMNIKARNNFLKEVKEEIRKKYPLVYKQFEEHNKYLSVPSEIYARLMQFRQENSLDPNHVYTIEEIEPLYKSSKVDDIQAYKLEDLIKMLNEVAYNETKMPIDKAIQLYNLRYGRA